MKNIKSITINGKTYVAKEFDFNMICDLQDMGVDISSIAKTPMAAVRAYVAICMGVDKELAGKEIESHVVNGGELDKVMETLASKFENSDFFRKLSQSKEKDNTEE